MAIESVQIGTNRNSLSGVDEVCLYDTALANNLTLGQLFAAVCLRAAATLEAQSVLKMNVLNSENDNINRLSEILSSIAAGTAGGSWSSLKTELAGFGIINLPTDLNSHDNRMQAMVAIKQKLEELTRQSQQDMIDLQTAINRRDVAMTTSTNLVRALGQSKSNMAGKLTR